MPDIDNIKLVWIRRNKIFGRPLVDLDEELLFMGAKIPKGTRTDGASLPPGIRGVLSPMSDYFPAALLHDYLLSTRLYTRQHCAHMFKRGLKALDMPAWLCNSFYWAVRAWDHVVAAKNWIKGAS